MYRVAVDVGGTFTDFVAVDEKGAVLALKIPTDEKKPLEVIQKGLGAMASEAGCPVADFITGMEAFIYGSTVAINALIEQKGVKTALLTTLGFRDAIEMRRSKRKEQWDFFAPVPPPLVPRRLRLGVRERLDYRGVPLAPVDPAQLEEAAGRLEAEGVQAVAVCLLFSFINPVHEKIVEEYLRRRLPGVFVSLSAEVSPRIREYERSSTTVLNAYLSPLLAECLQAIELYFQAGGFSGKLWLIQNNGGLTDTGSAAHFGVRGLFSGPAGGARGAAALSRLTGHRDLVLVDMGGTSFDVTIIKDHNTRVNSESEVEGYHVNLPMLDINTVGIGGGSVAWVDGCGMLRVGPRSAGSDPGPACYCKGGSDATITDALLILGLLNPDNFLGGKIALDDYKAYLAIDQMVAQPLGISVPEAALAMYRVASSLMVDAVHFHTVRRGFDPRDFFLAACGGAAPLFAGQIARGLGSAGIIVPANSSLFCAEGMLRTGAQYDVSQSCPAELAGLEPEKLREQLNLLLEKGREELSRLMVPEQRQSFKIFFEMKYADQHHELEVEYHGPGFTTESIGEIGKSFHRLHKKLYGYSQPDHPCRIVGVRVSAMEDRVMTTRSQAAIGAHELPEQKTSRPACWEVMGDYVSLPVYDGDQLRPGHKINGPAIIEKAYSTILVGSAETALCDGYKNIIIDLAEVDNER